MNDLDSIWIIYRNVIKILQLYEIYKLWKIKWKELIDLLGIISPYPTVKNVIPISQIELKNVYPSSWSGARCRSHSIKIQPITTQRTKMNTLNIRNGFFSIHHLNTNLKSIRTRFNAATLRVPGSRTRKFSKNCFFFFNHLAKAVNAKQQICPVSKIEDSQKQPEGHQLEHQSNCQHILQFFRSIEKKTIWF